MFQDMTVAENVFISNQPTTKFGLVDYKEWCPRRGSAASAWLRRRCKAHGQDAVGGRTADVEIAKALVGTVKPLILDQPTAVIAGAKSSSRFSRIRMLSERDVAIVYISHRLEEIFEIADRVTVLKDGRLVGTCDIGDVDRERLVSMMVGRDLSEDSASRPCVRICLSFLRPRTSASAIA